MARPPVIEETLDLRLVLNAGSVALTDDQFFQLCHDNEEYRIEMTARGELIIMSGTGAGSGWRNAKVTTRLGLWTEQDGSGLSFDSSTMFTLPNGAKRSPDGAWISKDRWRTLTAEERERFARLSPDFVIELRSQSDRLRDVKNKMEEYIVTGARMGWLLDPIENCAYIYRAAGNPERIENPSWISADPVLPGFAFDFREILNPPE